MAEFPKVTMNLDTKGYNSKPNNSEFGIIRNRLCASERIREIGIPELIKEIERGVCFTPAALEGTSGDSFKSQQLFCVDIDNKWQNTATKETIYLEGVAMLTVKEAQEALAENGIKWAFYYPTFSAEKKGGEITRFRLAIILDKPITDRAQAAKYRQRLAGILARKKPHSVDMTNDAARIFAGTCYRCTVNPDWTTTGAAIMEALPDPEPEQTPQPDQAEPARERQAVAVTYSRRQAKDLICRDWRRIINTILEPAKKGYNGQSSWICPFCGHGKGGDGLGWNKKSITGYGLKCQGAGGSCFSGNIIELYARVKGLEFNGALEELADYEGLALDAGRPLPAWEFEELEELPEDATPEEVKEAQERERAKIGIDGQAAIDAFMADVQSRRYEPIPTGITDIDKAIGGGLIREQLILLGAAPGVGKTALAQWMFEGMAKKGTTCLFLNLEMSRSQILARSLSRIAAEITAGAAKMSATDILQGYKWTDQQRESMQQAAQIYRQDIAPRMIYNPDGLTPRLDDIMAYMEHIAERAAAAALPAPIVVIDYLQIIRGNDREDDIAVIKRAVSAFKDYATKYKTVVFVIMAHNRESNKSGNVTMESGRDTSCIEYSADLQMALTYTACLPKRGADGKPIKGKSADELTEEDRQRITLKITKSRFASAGTKVDLFFRGDIMTYSQISNLAYNSPHRL